MRPPFRLPGLTAAASQLVAHVAVVFAAAFGAQLVAAANGNVHRWPALLAVVVAAACAGVSAVVHYLLGLIPAGTPKLASQVAQSLASVVTVFLTVFGGQLAIGGSKVTTVASLVALVVAASTAGASTAFHLLIGLLPASAPLAEAKGAVTHVDVHLVSDMQKLAEALWPHIRSLAVKQAAVAPKAPAKGPPVTPKPSTTSAKASGK